MALVPAAADAVILGARHEDRVIALRADVARDRREEARPTGAAVELHLRREELEVAPGADERALSVLVVERARACRLGRFLAKHRELLGGEDSPPFLLGVANRLDAGRKLVFGAAPARAEEQRGQCAHEEAPPFCPCRTPVALEQPVDRKSPFKLLRCLAEKRMGRAPRKGEADARDDPAADRCRAHARAP